MHYELIFLTDLTHILKREVGFKIRINDLEYPKEVYTNNVIFICSNTPVKVNCYSYQANLETSFTTEIEHSCSTRMLNCVIGMFKKIKSINFTGDASNLLARKDLESFINQFANNVFADVFYVADDGTVTHTIDNPTMVMKNKEGILQYDNLNSYFAKYLSINFLASSNSTKFNFDFDEFYRDKSKMIERLRTIYDAVSIKSKDISLWQFDPNIIYYFSNSKIQSIAFEMPLWNEDGRVKYLYYVKSLSTNKLFLVKSFYNIENNVIDSYLSDGDNIASWAFPTLPLDAKISDFLVSFSNK